MRLTIREAPAHVTAPTHRSIVRSPVGAVPIAVLLAFASVDEPPIAYLAVAPHAAQLASSSSSSVTFAGCASCLRLPPEPNPYRHVAGLELLRYATRNLECMRASGPLFAEPNSMADVEELTHMGFTPAVARDDTELPLLAFISRRPLSELAAADGSHAALRVSNIRASVQFWSLLHFVPIRTFSTSGARATWLSAPWTPLSIELIEVPSHMLTGVPLPSENALGLAHVSIDVTSLGLSCVSTIEVLQRRSKALFGRTLRVLTPPHQQMMGDLVAEVALVRAPDGVQLELVHRLGRLAIQPEDDWMLDESKLPPAPVKPTGDCAQQAS